MKGLANDSNPFAVVATAAAMESKRPPVGCHRILSTRALQMEEAHGGSVGGW